jgi:multidrug efflux pump subunit AcrA (membrane-fusion protein)
MDIGNAVLQMPAKQKTAAKYLAGFFAVMITLTFISRAADSFTIPIVTTEKLSGGALEYKVSADGSVYPLAQSAVFAPAGYRILSLTVGPGDHVSAGDKLAELDAAKMRSQLEAASEELERLQYLAAAQGVNPPAPPDGAETYAAERDLERANDKIEDAEMNLERARADFETTERSSQLRVSNAQGEVSAARRNLRELRDLDEISDFEIDEARNTLRRQELALEEAELTQEKEIEAARRVIEDREKELEAARLNAEDMRVLQSQAVEKANNAAETAASEAYRASLERNAANVGIAQAQRKVSELQALVETGGVVTADVDGTVITINGVVGSLTSEESLLTLSDNAAGTAFRADVREDDLKHILRESNADIVFTGESRAIKAVVESIAPIANEDGRFEVVATLPEGEWEPGVNGKMTIIQKTASFAMRVSNAAVRKDQIGYFVFVIREVEGVLGAGTVAERVDITVLEQDDTHCAIEGVLSRDDFIISGGNRPISEGSRIRTE